MTRQMKLYGQFGLIARSLIVCFTLAAGAAVFAADTPWLTVIGDPTQPGETTIQVNPVPVSVTDVERIMVVRVSRPKERTSPDGVRFRSFESHVRFDCTARTARFIHVDFFKQPIWTGAPFRRLVYAPDQIRPMAFREIEPNPAERIIRAACSF